MGKDMVQEGNNSGQSLPKYVMVSTKWSVCGKTDPKLHVSIGSISVREKTRVEEETAADNPNRHTSRSQ